MINVERVPEQINVVRKAGQTRIHQVSPTRFLDAVLVRLVAFVMSGSILLLVGCGDGSGTADSVDGTPVPTASGAALDWEAPLTSADGTALSDLSGYRVYYGTTSPISKTNSQNVDVGSATTYTFDSLPAGTYYFAVAAYDLLNNESDLSDATTKVITGS